MDTDRKPFLSFEDQILHLKKKGITFNKVSEFDAKNYLKNNNNFFKLYSYRKNYDKYADDKYIDLDFSYLKDLAIIDMKLRYTIVQLALDIEHYAKLEILRKAEDHSEDGYEIINDFITSLDDKQYKILKSELDRCYSSEYCKDLTFNYQLNIPEEREDSINNLPIWVFLEVIPFGRLVSFFGYCAKRFKDEYLTNTYYMLKTCKDIRNACAHSSCILNDLRPNTKTHDTSYSVSRELSKIKRIPKSTRLKRMSNMRLQQIITLLYTHKRIVTSEGVHNKAIDLLQDLSCRINKNIDYYANNSMVSSSFDFISQVIDNWFIKG
ncbi:Abi family protein [uncultured Faecalicoccus sp.]|uniref:Abi family protein n=1 Tax=uncultured Faecalicoccus sp. TaxID=1971760 RepID=UPI0025F19E91|nr:Abi family protein [uncultured Faecalicoccus sp.]